MMKSPNLPFPRTLKRSELLCVSLLFQLEVCVGQKTTFNMNIKFPKLNYSLLTELTTNIEDFVFMQIANVTLKNKGNLVTYNGSATPVYYSSQNNGENDRVVIDFGYVKVRKFHWS